jgi:UDPglucose 6-dehydrogenase
MHIGILGYGCVGKALHKSIAFHHNEYCIEPYDLLIDTSRYPKEENDVIFICLPTPTIKGNQNIEIIEYYLSQLRDKNYEGEIIFRSTITPKNCIKIIEEYGEMNLMFAPEFLSEHNSFEEHKHVVGVKNIFQAERYCEIFGTDLEGILLTNAMTACMVKTIHNCYGSLKVTFFNEIFDICEKEKINYRELVRILTTSTDHISSWYSRNSADGKKGFGGHCFIKDTVAFNTEYNLKTLTAAIEKNKEYREAEMKEVL